MSSTKLSYRNDRRTVRRGGRHWNIKRDATDRGYFSHTGKCLWLSLATY